MYLLEAFDFINTFEIRGTQYELYLILLSSLIGDTFVKYNTLYWKRKLQTEIKYHKI